MILSFSGSKLRLLMRHKQVLQPIICEMPQHFNQSFLLLKQLEELNVDIFSIFPNLHANPTIDKINLFLSLSCTIGCSECVRIFPK